MNIRVFAQDFANKTRANKAGAAGNQKFFHGFFY